ncbi:hypothetical protein LGM75_06065 [Burkholderia multivorans]|uniref:hypothetical protein n=1 Tax=Burkholderia multivorans TaxID=87883 RepID=UPI0015A5E44B|nr:hypothetical protein [Burkholderia multivorans]MBU9464856.1 hypothetical protein [Burkholderia multivorans]MCA8125909.1 hypothetical protein [Burkholderia multivorans]
MLRFTRSVIVQCLFTLAAVGCAADASLSAVIYERAKNVSSQKVLGPGHRCNTMLLLGFFAPEHIADDAFGRHFDASPSVLRQCLRFINRFTQ